MATPSTGSAILTGGSAVTQLYMGFAQADLVKEQANMQARIAEFNARLADYDAWKAQAFGQQLIARTQSEQDLIRGTTKVQAAAHGVKIDEGTLSEIVAENELNSMLNLTEITNRTSEAVMGYKRQASQLRMGGDLTRSQGQLRAGSTRLASVANYASTMGAYTLGYAGGNTDLNPTTKTSSPTGYSLKPQDYTLNGESKDSGLFNYSLNGDNTDSGAFKYFLMPGGR